MGGIGCDAAAEGVREGGVEGRGYVGWWWWWGFTGDGGLRDIVVGDGGRIRIGKHQEREVFGKSCCKWWWLCV